MELLKFTNLKMGKKTNHVVNFGLDRPVRPDS